MPRALELGTRPAQRRYDAVDLRFPSVGDDGELLSEGESSSDGPALASASDQELVNLIALLAEEERASNKRSP